MIFFLFSFFFFLPATLLGATMEGKLFPALPAILTIHRMIGRLYSYNRRSLYMKPQPCPHNDFCLIRLCIHSCFLSGTAAFLFGSVHVSCILRGVLAMQGRGWILCWFKPSCSHLSLLLFTDAL